MVFIALNPFAVKIDYEKKSIEELEEMWRDYDKRLTDRETFLETLLDNYMHATYEGDTDAYMYAIRENYKEKTGKECKLSGPSYELEYLHKKGVEYLKNQPIPDSEEEKNGLKEFLNKDQKYLITFKDIFDYVLSFEINPPLDDCFIKFFDKLDFASDEDKINLFLTLYYDLDDYNNLVKELNSDYDVKALFQKYKEIAKEYRIYHTYRG